MKLIQEIEEQRIEEAFAKKTYGPDPYKSSNPNTKPVNLELSWASRYNGVSMTMDDDTDVTREMETAFDSIGDLAEITDEWHPYQGPSDAQVNELINAAKEMIKHVIPNANISFDIDDVSS